ncbi:MAG: aldo/keto reductase [Neisseria sp.]|nr:aldo/keto reductase [Neisseria sp.]
MILNETFSLSNGVAIPKLGLGTWMIDNDQAAQAVRDAVSLGYRHIDTAEGYGNEQGVGEGIRTCGVARSELFVTSKLQADYKTYHEAKAGIEQSLADLDIDYIDLMLIHAPQPWTAFREGEHFFEGNLAAWRALEEAYQAGKLRAIGVSNFEQVDLENLITHGTVKPMVNQVLAHISNTPSELIAYCQAQDILVEAYSPIAHGEMLNNPSVAAMAAHYQVSVPQLCIRYCLQLGLLPLPKTANRAHMQANAQTDFAISAADMQILADIKPIEHYGEGAIFPVFGGKLNADGTLTARPVQR